MHVRDIKIEAKERFALNRYHAMLVYGVVYTIALNIAVLTTVLFLLNKWAIWYGVILIFLFLLMLAPFGYGMTAFYIRMYKFEKIDAFHIFDGFNKYNLERVIVLRLLSFALWLAFTVLLIVPGIVFAIRTSMATYILCANPKMKPQEALKASSKIMKSHCRKFFALGFSFLGWFLMGLATCGLGFIWVLPYFNTAKIVFYQREILGDKAVYRNPLSDEMATIAPPSVETVGTAESEAVIRPSVSERDAEVEICEQDGIEPQFYDSCAAETVPLSDPTVESEEVAQAEAVSERAEVEAESVVDTSVRTAPSERTERTERVRRETGERRPAGEGRGDREYLRAEKRPLPGGRVVIDSGGRRTMVTGRPIGGSALPFGDRQPVEINEAGESVKDRLERLRAERNALRERQESDEDDSHEPRQRPSGRRNVEIEDK